jgi:hypothetical protein
VMMKRMYSINTILIRIVMKKLLMNIMLLGVIMGIPIQAMEIQKGGQLPVDTQFLKVAATQVAISVVITAGSGIAYYNGVGDLSYCGVVYGGTFTVLGIATVCLFGMRDIKNMAINTLRAYLQHPRQN